MPIQERPATPISQQAGQVQLTCKAARAARFAARLAAAADAAGAARPVAMGRRAAAWGGKEDGII